MKRLFIVLIVLALSGCAKPGLISRNQLGRIIDTNYIEGSFFSCDKTQVKAERGSVILVGWHNVPVGVNAYWDYMQDSDGCRSYYLTWDGAARYLQTYLPQ